MSDPAARPPLRFGVAYDFRNPPDSPTSLPDLYAQILEQAAFVDQLGYDLIWLTEHHFVEDGYLPAFVPVAGAIAARTARVRLSTDIALLPFHHPIRLAEDLAVLDNLSGGRMELGIGMGYALHEFAAFGIPRANRVSLTEEGIEVLQRAWSGEPFSFEGKRWRFDDVQVFPAPVQAGGPPLWLAAMKEPGARRAGRLGLHLLPQGNRAEVLDPWREELAAAGADASGRRVGILRSWLVTDDPERDWPPIRAAERYKMAVYSGWLTSSGDDYAFGDADRSPIPQTWMVGGPDEVADQLIRFVTEFGITDVVGWGAPPGVAPAALVPSLERFAREVVPQVRAAVDGAAPLG